MLDVPFVHPVNIERRILRNCEEPLFGDMEASSLRSLVPRIDAISNLDDIEL